MAQTLAGKDQWFVVHVLSGQENKVKENIDKRVKTEEMSDLIYEVLVPTERVSEIKKGKKSETTRKFFPGYLIVNMHLLDENNQLVGRTWYFIRETPGVIGFAGTKDKPIPMRQSEVDSMLAQMKEREEKVKPKVSFEVGETVKVADGPFQNQNGIVEEIDPERGKLRVSVTIFGRATPVELEYWQVMAKEVIAHIKLQIPAGQANPAPPVGTALGPRGINIMAFCKEFNAATQKQAGDILPVVITVFKDKSFTFITKSPPAAVLLKKAANIAAGSKEPNKEKVGKVTRKQVMDIVKTKAKDLNARSDEAAFRIIEGTARQMGLEIVD